MFTIIQALVLFTIMIITFVMGLLSLCDGIENNAPFSLIAFCALVTAIGAIGSIGCALAITSSD